jgi:murein DD-endopeptidase MepM/ murein hydrolase activator NlpD
MKCWPVPNSYSKTIPKDESQGSFWENREDRHHCGIDIYAPEGSNVLSIEDGIVIESGTFTPNDIIPYWNKTYFVMIKNNSGLICKYAELNDVIVSVNNSVKAGQLIGHVGLVLNSNKINEKSPSYIQKIKRNGQCSMLHFELYKSIPIKSTYYLGGNWFSHITPEELLNPTYYIKNID